MGRATQTIGNGALVQKRVVRINPCRLAALVGFNNGGDAYVQIHDSAAEPAANAVPVFSFLADGGRAYAFALPTTVDMSACTVVFSSTLATYTASAGTPGTIQAILEV